MLQLLTSVISCQYILNTGVKYDENLLLKYPYLCHLSPLVPVGLSLAISKNTALEQLVGSVLHGDDGIAQDQDELTALESELGAKKLSDWSNMGIISYF